MGTATPSPPRPIDEIVRDLERRHADLALGDVAAWKRAAPGRLAVGCLPVLAPREVLWAAGALPVFVRGGGDRIDAVRGDAYYQSYICHLPRSTIELGLAGHLDVLDAMVFPNTCDVIRNLSGIWQDLFPRVLVRFLDPPQTPHGSSAAARLWRHELARLRDDLCARSGRAADDAALYEAIADFNHARAAARRLGAARAAAPWNVPADEAYLLRRAGDAMPPRAWAALVDEYLAAAAGRRARVEDRIRVVLVGAFCEQPPVALLRAAERSGCYLVDDDLTVGLTDIDGDVEILPEERGDPLLALARATLRQGRACAVRYDERGDAGDRLVAQVRALAADGVLFAAPSFCDPALLEQPRLTRALDDAGIPHTAFKYAENTGQFQSIREQAGTFADSVKLWGSA
jgi:benzoyl-CoA reductase subunit C